MAQAGNQDLTERFIQFYRGYYRDEIGKLAQRYPNEQRSLYIDYDDLYRFDRDLAEDFRAKPDQLTEYAEEGLRLFDLPADVKLGNAHVRMRNLPGTIDIRNIRVHDDHIGTLIAVQGIVRKATDVRPKITEAAFECQRCGTMTYIPQADGGFQEPHECQGCERQGPFRINFDQSEFIDAQKIRVQESPEGLRGGETPQSIDINIEDDITGKVTPGDHVTVVGVLHIEQMSDGQEKSALFDLYMDGVSITVEDEEFEDMDISEEDVTEIVELSSDPDIYEKMVASVAPSIYGYDEEKLAMILQLFSGVTKHLPDGSRIRGDLHMLLIGDPGTGKCVSGDTAVTLADGRSAPIGELVESNLTDPKPIDDGMWDDVAIEVPSLHTDGTIAPATATKVWKREAPDTMYRIRTEAGRELDVTPSHPLFVPTAGGHVACRADRLSVGDAIATAPVAIADGGTASVSIADGGVASQSPAAPASRQIRWDRIDSIDRYDPNEAWVYDLEIDGTHTYLTNEIVSHNSQMLSYIQNIAPRSVYTSGKGSSSAGLCVTGDTLIHTDDGLRPIRELAHEHHPKPVDENVPAEAEYGLYTYNRDAGSIDRRSSSHVWRMPKKPCRRLETAHGKRLETSVNTPVLVCSDEGLEWRSMSDVESGDHVAVPKYDVIDRSTPPVSDFLGLTTEKLKPTAESIEFLRRELTATFGTLRDAAAAIGLSEDFIYDSLSNRHLPRDRLGRILAAIDADFDDIDIERAMVNHGDSIRIPTEFDEELLYLVGLVFGDGDIAIDRRDGNRGMVRISNSDEEILNRAASIIESQFDKSVEIEHQDGRVPCIRIQSVTIARWFANLGMRTPKDELALDPRLTTAEHADAFLRGLFDADGSVCGRTDGGSSVQFSTISPALARQVQLMLETYGIRSRTRDRDRRGTYELDSGQTIETKAVQTHLAIYGRNLDGFADRIGFGASVKSKALEEVVDDADRRGEKLPIGSALEAVDIPAGSYHTNLTRGDNPSRSRATAMCADLDLGEAHTIVEEAIDAQLRWDEVVSIEDTGRKEVYDLTVPETHNFVANGVITHNTAAAVRDDFGDGQQWTLEAGALVLADKGIAAVDELDKMRCVTGDTLVQRGDGQSKRIEAIAEEAATAGAIEELPNGRTIRDVDFDVWTMTEAGRLVRRSVTAVHEYNAPEELTAVTLESGESLTSTPDHPFFVFEDGERIERSAAALEAGDRVYVPEDRPTQSPAAATDGGSVVIPESSGAPVDRSETDQPEDPHGDVTCRRVASVTQIDTSTVGDRPDPKVYDLTVEETHNFVANGMVVHNSEDRSAMHEALEQQQISVSKAGINATLKSRCSLLGAANPKYGRFDRYEPIGEQIDLEPALISRFDLIFTVTDQPDPDHDANLAEHILKTNYAGELNTQRERLTTSEFTQAQVDEVTEEVAPEIDAELLRKYIAHAKRSCFPTMTDEAKEAIRDFYVDLRSKGADEDAPVPVTARKLEGLVRLSEASARIRLSDTVEPEDATRVIDIVRSCLQDIGVDPETGEFDADVVETGTSKSQRDRIKNIKSLIADIEAEYEEGAPIDEILERAGEIGMDQTKAEKEIEKLRRKGEVYEPTQDYLRTT
ncbi:LAGLIDADG family homing endonuclease [Halalkalirubrum salinum]|uniref:LAGLIDADG family homing endonuclease n=1 Tax=Halalkalirubrum salinum TaxID=2563889 RepID=UPI0010FBA316|nr:LAGLIDADG family homing endonuclease [Halalkalirubrum salinum]